MALTTTPAIRITTGTVSGNSTWITSVNGLTDVSWSRVPDLRRVNQGHTIRQISLGTYTTTLSFTVDDDENNRDVLFWNAGYVEALTVQLFGDTTSVLSGDAYMSCEWLISRSSGRTMRWTCTFSGEPTVTRT